MGNILPQIVRNGAHVGVAAPQFLTSASNGYALNGHKTQPELSRAEFEAIADANGYTIPDGPHRRGPNHQTGEGKDGTCLFWPECNISNRDGSFKMSRREVLESFGVSINAPSASTENKTFDTRSLEDRGMTPDARRFFSISEALDEKSAWGEKRRFPTFHPNGTKGRYRDKFRDPSRQPTTGKDGKPRRPVKTLWCEGKKEDQPVAYGLNWIEAGEQVYIVNSELAVWLFWQERKRAICPLGEGRSEQSFRAIFHAIKDKSAANVVLMLDADETGQKATATAIKAAHDVGLKASAKRWPEGVKSGFDASDFWEQCHAHGRDFSVALDQLFDQHNIPTNQPTATPGGIPVPSLGPRATANLRNDEQPPPPMFEIWSYKQLRALPRLSWLIDQILPVGGTSWLTATSGHLKSFWAIDAACCIATGHRFHGRAVKRGNVVYVAAEGAMGLPDRLDAWAAKHQTEVPDVPALAIIKKPADVATPEVWTGFIASIRALEPVFIVLDTQSRCSVGRDLNSTAEATIFYDAVSRLAEELGAQILIVAHNNRTGQYAGNHQGPAMVDTHLTLKREGTNLQFRCAKQKDGAAEEDAAMNFETRVFELDGRDEQGRTITSLALEAVEMRAEDKPDTRDKNAEVRGEMLNILSQHFPKGAGAKAWQEKCAELKICQKTAFYDRRDELKAKDQIEQICGCWLLKDAPGSSGSRSSFGSSANSADLPDLAGSSGSRSSSPVGTTNREPANLTGEPEARTQSPPIPGVCGNIGRSEVLSTPLFEKAAGSRVKMLGSATCCASVLGFVESLEEEGGDEF